MSDVSISKMKKLTIQVSGYTITALILFSALFSADGMGLAFNPNDIGWHTIVANIIENFVVLLNVFFIATSAIFMAALIWKGDEISKVSVDQLVEQVGVLRVASVVKWNKFLFFTISLPTWIILVASGWIFTMMVLAFMYGTFQFMFYLQRNYFKSEYINELQGDNDEKPTTASSLTDNDLV